MMNSSHNNERIAKNSIVLYFRTFITMFIGMFTTRVVLQTLGEVDLGLYNVVGGVVMILASIQGSLSVASSRFLAYVLGTGSESEQKSTFQSVFTVHFLLAMVSVFFFETIGLYIFYTLNIPAGRETACWICYQFSVMTSFFTLLFLPFTSIVIAHEEMGFYAYLTFLDVILKLLILYIMAYFPYDKLITYGILIFLVTLIGIIVNVTYSYKKYRETSLCLQFSKQSILPILKFSGWTAVGNFAYTLADQGGSYLLNIFYGPAVNAARMLSMQVNSITSRFVQGFQTAINPQIIKSYAKQDFIYMHKLIYSSSVYSFFVLFVLGFSIYFILPDLLSLWLGNYPDYTVPFVRIILIRTLFAVALANPLQTAINATAKLSRTNIAISVCYFLTLIVTFVCLKFGANATSVFIISLFFNIAIVLIRASLLGKLIDMSFSAYFVNVFWRVFVPCSITIIIYFLIDTILYKDYFILNVVIPPCLSLLIIYSMGLTKQEKNYILCFLKRFYFLILNKVRI